MRNSAKIILVANLCLLYCQMAMAFDDEKTHPNITEIAVQRSILKNFPSQNLGLSKDYDTVVNGKKIIKWIMEGSISEDHPLGRASHHFHNPLLSWNQSQMSDSALPIIWSALTGWLPTYSNITWATGYTSQTVKADMSNAYNPYLTPPLRRTTGITRGFITTKP